MNCLHLVVSLIPSIATIITNTLNILNRRKDDINSLPSWYHLLSTFYQLWMIIERVLIQYWVTKSVKKRCWRRGVMKKGHLPVIIVWIDSIYPCDLIVHGIEWYVNWRHFDLFLFLVPIVLSIFIYLIHLIETNRYQGNRHYHSYTTQTFLSSSNTTHYDFNVTIIHWYDRKRRMNDLSLSPHSTTISKRILIWRWMRSKQPISPHRIEKETSSLFNILILILSSFIHILLYYMI